MEAESETLYTEQGLISAKHGMEKIYSSANRDYFV